MKRVTLKGTDLNVSQLCVGCWQFNDNYQSPDKTWPAQPIEVSKSIVDSAISNGINFFDTAQAYPNSEEVLGKILEGRRKDVVIATKMGGGQKKHFAPEDIEAAITQSLTRLKTDYLDLYQVHWPHFISTDVSGCVAELNRQQSLGRIKHYGVCNFGPKNLQEVLDAGGKPVSNQISYSLLWRPVEYDILPLCDKNNMGVLAYSPLQQGLLTGKFKKLEDVPEGRRRTRLFNANSTELCRHGEDGAEKQMFKTINDISSICESNGLNMAATSLAWLLRQPSVQSVIVGASSPQQVQNNVQVPELSQDLLTKLDEASRELKEIFGNSPDMWSHESRIA